MDNLSTDLIPTADQYFLLNFIIGIYFAPDLKEEKIRKPVLQRYVEGLPPYISNQLAGSFMSMVEMERVYYCVVRKASRSVIMKPPMLRLFFQGNLPAPVEDPSLAYPQFDDLFPPKLHPRTQSGNQYDMVQNIVFINEPDISYIKPEDIDRFKRLTGLEEFHLDGESSMLHNSVGGEMVYDLVGQEEDQSEDFLHRGSAQNFSAVPYTGTPTEHNMPSNGTLPLGNNFANPLMDGATIPSPTKTSSADDYEPRKIFLPSFPSREVWSNIIAATKNGFSVTGSAARGQVGPVIGLIDIGESDDSYLFRVSLPGVKRDEREFSCEVENDGKVLIKGVATTGEKTVHKYSQVFEMQSQNLCPSGNFSISFNLPGPVDPRQFSGNFGTDGILEGIAMKAGQC
nr:increased DNA methylation 2-like isoform X1 [Coffea arabica]